LKSIYHKSGWLCTVYDQGSLYAGSEGELYNMNDDPGQLTNRWEDANCASVREELTVLLKEVLPPQLSPRLERRAPV